MAVIVQKKTMMEGNDVWLRIYRPSGSLTKEEREKAEALDDFLHDWVPEMAKEISNEEDCIKNNVRRWFSLGLRLRELSGMNDIVLLADVDSGVLWDAVWQYLPKCLRPKGSEDLDDYSERRGRRKDHLTLCYEIAEYKWEDVKWLERWDDWHQLAFRPGLVRDPRIMIKLGKHISKLKRYPSCEEYRTILMILRDAFPTKKMRDSSGFTDRKISKIIKDAIKAVMKE